jgi:penicillin-binding protein 1A
MQNVNTPNKKNTAKKKRRFPLTLLYIIAGIFLVATVFFSLYISEGLPSLEELESPRSQLASNVWSSDGQLIGQFFRQNRVEVGIDSIPQHVINALIATEDKNFYNHWGVDVQRFIKAMIKNIFLFKREICF